jgi:hemoglobin-like flavoprotein
MGAGSCPRQVGDDVGVAAVAVDSDLALPAWSRDALSPAAQTLPVAHARNAERALLRRTGAVLARDPQVFGATFYRILFARLPELRALFPDDMGTQQHKLGAMLDHLLDGLDEPECLALQLAELGRRHRGYGATFVHYLAVGEALLQTLSELNGPSFDPGARLVWSRLYSWIVYRMRHAPLVSDPTGPSLRLP